MTTTNVGPNINMRSDGLRISTILTLTQFALLKIQELVGIILCATSFCAGLYPDYGGFHHRYFGSSYLYLSQDIWIVRNTNVCAGKRLALRLNILVDSRFLCAVWKPSGE